MLRIGTSGWNYPAGEGTWNGIFYPPSRGRAKSFDELSFYAEHFDTVEVNSTFYGMPRAEVCRAWHDRTPRGFEFSVKLYQKFTHPEMFKQQLSRGLSRAAAGLTFEEPGDQQMLSSIARPNQTDLDQFRDRHRAARGRGQAGRAARSVSGQLQGCAGFPRLACTTPARFLRLPRRRRTAAQELERSHRRDTRAAQRA